MTAHYLLSLKFSTLGIGRDEEINKALGFLFIYLDDTSITNISRITKDTSTDTLKMSWKKHLFFFLYLYIKLEQLCCGL